MASIVVETLRAKLKVLDDEYHQNRKEILDAISQLSGEIVLKDKDSFRANNVARISDARVRFVSEAVKIALQNMPEEFDLSTARHYIEEHFPDLFKSNPVKSINARIWEACNDPDGDFKIAIGGGGRGGKPNIYTRKNKSGEMNDSDCPPRPSNLTRKAIVS